MHLLGGVSNRIGAGSWQFGTQQNSYFVVSLELPMVAIQEKWS